MPSDYVADIEDLLDTNPWDDMPEFTGEWEDPYEDLYQGSAWEDSARDYQESERY
jgi:hypothetical protein